MRERERQRGGVEWEGGRTCLVKLLITKGKENTLKAEPGIPAQTWNPSIQEAKGRHEVETSLG